MMHPSVEFLSTYLDDRLVEAESRRVEAHLRGCAECRGRLQGMRRVVGRLEAMQRMAPPPQIGYEIRRLTAQEADRPSLLEKLEKGAGRFTLPASVLPAFAVVLALVVIIYLLSWGVERRQAGGPTVIVESKQETSGESRPAAAERVSRLQPPTALEPESRARADSEGRPLGAELGLLSEVEERSLRAAADRVFERRDEVWIERGLDSDTPARRLRAEDPSVVRWLDEYPELRELQGLGGIVRLRIEGQVVEIEFTVP